MPDMLDLYANKIFTEPNTGCWLCVSMNNRYGYARLPSKDGRRVGAHRISYELSVGPLPGSMEVDHLCRVSCCVNPQHLEAVTQIENKRRQAVARDRDRQFACPNGHKRTPENIYVKLSTGAKCCKACRRLSRLRCRPNKHKILNLEGLGT